jgi:hypothetical protein
MFGIQRLMTWQKINNIFTVKAAFRFGRGNDTGRTGLFMTLSNEYESKTRKDKWQNSWINWNLSCSLPRDYLPNCGESFSIPIHLKILILKLPVILVDSLQHKYIEHYCLMDTTFRQPIQPATNRSMCNSRVISGSPGRRSMTQLGVSFKGKRNRGLGMSLKNTIFWDIMPCSPLKANRRFEETYLLKL